MDESLQAVRRDMTTFLLWLAEGLNGLPSFSQEAERVARWAEELERQEYKLAFVGRFCVGKSTLLNALLEEEIFPMGILPTTPTVVFYRCNPKGSRVAIREPGKPGEKVLLDERAPDGGSPQLARRIYLVLKEEFDRLNKLYEGEVSAGGNGEPPIFEVEVRYPLGPHAEGVLLVDMPGTEDLSRMRRDIVLRYLPEMDAVVFVFDAGQPMSRGEKEFFRTVWEDYGVRTLFAVGNKVDTIPRVQEREAAVRRIEEHLQEVTGREMPVYPLNAFQALAAVRWRKGERPETRREEVLRGKYETPEEMWRASGIEELRQAIWRFVESDERLVKQIEDIRPRVEEVLDRLRLEAQRKSKAKAVEAKVVMIHLDILMHTKRKIQYTAKM